MQRLTSAHWQNGIAQECPGVRFQRVKRMVHGTDFRGAAIKYAVAGDVYGFFVQPLAPDGVDVYACAQRIMQAYSRGWESHVEVPEFEVATQTDLAAIFGLQDLALPRVAPDAQLAVLQQSATLKCSKDGTIAAAATTAVFVTRGAVARKPDVATMRINGPFTFLIARHDAALGLVPLFVAVVNAVARRGG